MKAQEQALAQLKKILGYSPLRVAIRTVPQKCSQEVKDRAVS
jgi:hypothetical protein